jgi:hypothetical protein
MTQPVYLREMKPITRMALLNWAHDMRERYHAPVYLVGSALRKRDPRDVDIRIRLTDKDFGVRYGGPRMKVAARLWVTEGKTGCWSFTHWNWARECSFITQSAWSRLQLNIDFQVYPACYWRKYAGKPRYKLA